MEWNDAAIVLQTGRFRETDMWLRLLSQRHGLVTAFAFGGSRSRRRFCGCLDTLNTISCRVKSSRNGQYLALEEGNLLKGPQRLRKDWARLGMVMNCIRFLEALGVSQDGAAAGYALLQEILALFEGDTAPHTLVPVLFRLRMATEQGFAPAWHECEQCHSPLTGKNVLFRMNEGSAMCETCVPHRGSSAYSIHIPAASLALLHTVQGTQPQCWNVGSLTFQQRQACFGAVDGFVQYHLGIAWEEGRFRRV